MSDKSYEKINYALRPAKCIERKMLCNVLGKLSCFRSVDSYRYIGFGSTNFSDFALFHKTLGITNMISIERDVENRERFLFNLPYKCISVEFDESNVVLPRLEWKIPTILWLDYDDRLNANMLTDVKFFCASALPGSLLILTVNAQPDKLGEPRLDQLRQRVGEEKVPLDVNEHSLSGWETAQVYRRIINNEIAETLMQRNGTLSVGSRLQYKQLMHFHYADGAKMLTVGGVIYDEGQKGIIAGCHFEALPFVKTEQVPYEIETPNLTYREIHHLDSQLPTQDHQELTTAVPLRDREVYSRVYRYFPTFAETEA